MPSEPEASGRALLGVIRQIKDRQGGTAELPSLIAGCGPRSARTFSDRLSLLDWYPYDDYVALISAIDRRYGKGDGAYGFVLGDEAGRRDLGTAFRIYAALASAERLIRGCSRVWSSYYRNAGRMEAVAWRPTETVLRIYDFRAMAPIHCRLMEGWMISTMGTLGFKVNRDAMESECMSRGGRHHEFRCTWTK